MAQRATGPDLTNIAPVSERYATAPVAEAFNWDECAEGVDAGAWYLVAFRSVLRESADRDRLWESDRRAHEEAARAPGFIHYFKGPPNDRRECLSFCVWESREHARGAARRTAHLEAVELIHEMYESYVLEFLRLTKSPGDSGFRFDAYDRVGAA